MCMKLFHFCISLLAQILGNCCGPCDFFSFEGYDLGFGLWHSQLWSFKTRDTKLEIFLHKNQHTQRNLLKFENWTNGEPHNLQKSEFLKLIILTFHVKKWITSENLTFRFLEFFCFFRFFLLKLVYFWTKSRKNV